MVMILRSDGAGDIDRMCLFDVLRNSWQSAFDSKKQLKICRSRNVIKIQGKLANMILINLPRVIYINPIIKSPTPS